MIGLLAGLLATAAPGQPAPGEVSRVALGSCVRQHRPQPVWDAVLASRPDLFVLMGDNVYADTTDPERMRAAYAALGAEPGFLRLRERVALLATWDDHDYGANDAGAEYPMRDASQRIFADFFGLPADSPVRARPGVYDARTYGPPGRRVQVVLLDTRYFRGPLTPGERTEACPRTRYAPNADPAVTMLGEGQWAWLGERLREPAELRLLVSSVQVIPEEHCFEKWANLPHERERLFGLLAETGAEGVVLLSGDRHHAEVSRLHPGVVAYPLYELTSSSLNAGRGPAEESNRHRVGALYGGENFGLVRVDWEAPEPTVNLEIRDAAGAVVEAHALRLGELRRPVHR